ncbi:MAG: fused MFS/spermidine synthase, partial [Candidatus Hydrogenedentota bacterium]
MKNWKTAILLSVLFFTSLCSLVYELVWTRKLSLIFGTSALAVSTVLSVFMAGLALGSLYGGRFIERSRKPYRFLAVLQLLIGTACLATLFLIDGIKYLYVSLFNFFGEVNVLFNITHFVLSCVILFPPTFLIGTAFPTIVKLYYHERNTVGGSVSRCYAADTLGAALGVLLVGFFSIWTIGLFKTSLAASIINILLGVLLIVFFGKQDLVKIRVTTGDTARPITDKLILVLFFFSGLAALTLENVWIRFFDLIYGNSIVSFSIVVASFLIGLGLGSFVAQFFVSRANDRIFLFALIELLIGVTSLIVLLLFPYLEHLFLVIFFKVRYYSWFIFLLGATSILLLLFPTCLMGMTLPVLSTVYVNGRTIGSD